MNELTKREYFAANAPKLVPNWFKPEMPTKPQRLAYMFNKFGKDSGHQYGHLFQSFWDDENNCWCHNPDTQPVPQEFKDEVEKYLSDFQKSCDQVDEYEKKYIIERMIQWPIYWADMVLKKLGA